MHFLVGFLILCVIIAVPALRVAGLILIGIAVIRFLIVLASSSNTKQSVKPLDPLQAEQQEAARMAAAQAYEKSKTLIKTNELEIRNIWITQYGSPVITPKTPSIEADTILIVKNNSPNETLIEIFLEVKLFDCPLPAQAVTEKCDQIGGYRAQVNGDVPPEQVRQMKSRNITKITDIPPVRGGFFIQYSIPVVRGKL